MKYIKPFDYIFILRPMLHLPVWTILILGYCSSDYSSGGKWELLYSLLVGTCLFGAIFVINQIYDIETDRLNRKLHFLPDGHIKVGVARVIAIVLNLIAFTGALRIGFWTGIASVIIMMLGVLYSVPPIALKNRAWPAALANGIGHGTMVYLIGYLAAGGSPPEGIWRSLPYFFAVMAVYAGTTLPDIKGDDYSGKKTLAVVYGERRTFFLMFWLFLTGLGCGFVLKDLPFILAALAAAPFFIYAYLKKKVYAGILAVKMSIITLSIAAAYFVPLYLVFISILVIATRGYYKARFGVVYPSMK